MCLKRYLTNFSYLGTSFRGSQRQVKRASPIIHDPTTVQGNLEMGLNYINRNFETAVYMSSRTDAGVHALNATCHFDLHRENGQFLEPQVITNGLNKFFLKNETQIRILKTQIVDDTFHCRHNSTSRTYLYRLIIGRFNKCEDKLTTASHFFPIEETNKAYFCCSDSFDLNILHEAAKMFEGLHDFRTFKGKTEVERETRRKINSIRILQRTKQEIGVSTEFTWPQELLQTNHQESHELIDIYFNGKGFLYKQVRRIAATLLAASTGRISLKEIQFMLQVPSKHSWNPRIRTLPGHGLYLCKIFY